MATSALSLPIDVPWKRLAISQDMYAPSIEADLPEKWRSSLAVFFYEPDPDPTDVSGEVTTFLKLVTSITGYNYDSVFHLPFSKTGLAGVTSIDLTTYYPALCALAQVAVFPDTGQWDLAQYPYFTDFQPKQREVVETQTATGEEVTHTVAPVNATKSTTTVQNDIAGTQLDQAKETQIVDASRERRETMSYSTNIAQLYQLLDSYHSGTNRAVFLTMARPHLVDSVYTFVNGPRRLEGIQEFFLVVRRSKNMTGICVKATLETAHLDPSDASGNPATMFTSSRVVSGCTGAGGTHVLPAGPWITYEQQLSSSINDLLDTAGQSTGVQAVASANAVGRAVNDMLIGSFRAGSRYPLGTVDLLHTNFAMRKLIAKIPPELHAEASVASALKNVHSSLLAAKPLLSTRDLIERTRLLAALGVSPAEP